MTTKIARSADVGPRRVRGARPRAVVTTSDRARLAFQLRQRLDRMGVSAEEVAVNAGLTANTILAVLNAEERDFQLETFRRLAEAVGWRAGTFLEVLAKRPEPPATA